MKGISPAAIALVIACTHEPKPDFHLAPEPWARGTLYKGGSGTGTTSHNIARSRAKAKAARKARKIHRHRSK